MIGVLDGNREVQMSGIDLNQLRHHATELVSFTPDRQQLITETSKDMLANFGEVTNNIYNKFKTITKISFYADAKSDELNTALSPWVEALFTGRFDDEFVKNTFMVGESCVKLNLPAEFITGGVTLLGQELTGKTFALYTGDMEKCAQVIAALNAMLAFCQIIMQAAYKASEAQALEKFLVVTGMSHALYVKLAQAYQ